MFDEYVLYLNKEWEQLPDWVFVVCCCFVAFAVVQLIYYWGIYCGIFRYRRKVAKQKIDFLSEKPPVSVIICARNEEKNLREKLPLILEQDYPDFEVIVVDDASDDDTHQLLYMLSANNQRLKMRQIPKGAKFSSPKKFAVTLGIKAAQNDILLFTDADCRPTSNQWISQMVANFVPGVQIVLGYGGYERKSGFVSYAISYDTVTIALQYLSFALAGNPYMGVGRNMAYRKSFFETTPGFVSHMNLQSGDDDLFVNAHANKKNTRVEFSKESTTVSEPKTTLSNWFLQKQRHLSTSPLYKTSSRFLIGLENFSKLCFYGLFIACIVSLNGIALSLSILLFLVRMISQYATINKFSSIVGDRSFKVGVVFLDIFMMFFNLFAFTPKKDKVYKWK